MSLAAGENEEENDSDNVEIANQTLTATSPSLCVMVEDEQRAFQCIRELKMVRDDKDYGLNDRALGELRKIFDKYLELPSLLDRCIASMVEEMTSAARPILTEVSAFITKERNNSAGKDYVATKFKKFVEESPLPRILSAIYALSKVRGRKRVQKFLSHQVEDVEPVLNSLWLLDSLKQVEHDVSLQVAHYNIEECSVVDGAPQLWESLHTLWNWMGIIGKIPFDCEVVVETSQISRLLQLTLSTLSETGPIREIAASCLACWLTRPDFEHSEFQTTFQTWAKGILEEHTEGTMAPSDSRSHTIFTVLGILQTLVTILKVSTADRDVLLSSMELYSPLVSKISSSNNKSSSLLLRKYLVKWWTRIGVLYMPPRIASWRYQRGRRLILENLQQHNQHKEQSSAVSLPADIPKPTINKLSSQSRQGIDDYFFLVPDQVETAMDHVLRSLTDDSTGVRWSSAKGVGRITSRLPAICAEDVLDAVLSLFDDKDRDNDWHGACLALAEMARRGLLLRHRLEEVVAKIVVAIHYDVPRRQRSVGAHVRDAACYTYWALSRAYAPEILKPYVPQLGESIVVAFLFDREVNCRRAASAAFQEMVGRQGAQNFKNGISILTAADYFSLGSRTDAYTSIAQHVADFVEYRKAIITHLFRVKLSHWDLAVRILASQSLGGLTLKDPLYMTRTVLPYLLESCLDPEKLETRHGATLGVAEIVLAFGRLESIGRYLSRDLLDSIAEIVPIIEKRRLYRGKGGEHMRAAVCRLIECVSIARIPLTVPQQVRFLDSVDACLPHPKEDVQDHAGKAIHQLLRAYFPVRATGPSTRLQNRVVDKYTNMVRTSVNPAAARGFALALGCLPAKLLAPSPIVLDLTLSCLCRAARPDARVGLEKDAETRRNALLSLVNVCETVICHRPEKDSQSFVAISEKQINHVFSALLRAMEDYNRDQRGDVGSKCRVVAMKGLVRLAALSCQEPIDESEYFSKLCLEIVGLILKQFAEKLDSIRSEAAGCLMECLGSNSPIKSYVAKQEILLEALTPLDFKSVNWADASITFPMIMKAAEIDEYFEYIISGIIVSVGCLTQSVCQHASVALIDWCRKAGEEKLDHLGRVLLGIFDKHSGEGRVILPLLKTINVLMNRNCLERLVRDISFTSSLLSKLREERKKCTDIPRLHAILNVATGLILSVKESQEATAFVCELLMHEYPRIRSLAAEKLYVRLQETDPDLDETHTAVKLLLHHSWDYDGVEEPIVRDVALQVSKAFNVNELWWQSEIFPSLST